MNPTGNITFNSAQDRLDAIQEYINEKYHLVSPKDAMRVSDQNYASVLSRTKGDLFNERGSEVKKLIYSRMEADSVTSLSGFESLLAEYGEVKTRNEGRAGQYFAVKLHGDKKFTNLKSPLFSTSFIESRHLPLVKPTQTQIKNRLDDWLNKASYENKHIYPASSKVREHYKSLDEQGKARYLRERINQYDERHQLNPSDAARAKGRARGHERGFNPASRPDRITAGIGLPRLSERTLVYGVRGRAAPSGSVRVLPDNEQRDMAERREEGQRADTAVRRPDDNGRGRVRAAGASSVVHDALASLQDRGCERSERAQFATIRREIDPERFLSAVAVRFAVNAERHTVTRAKDGSPRFAAGKQNLNASDFLTKHLYLPWQEAREVLLTTWEQQKENVPFEVVSVSLRLTREEAAARFDSLKTSQQALRAFVRDERQRLVQDVREMRQQLRRIPPKERDIARGVLTYIRLTRLETLAEQTVAGRDSINHYHQNWHEGKNAMESLSKLKSLLHSEENGIEAAEPSLSLQKAVEAQQRLEALRQAQLKDLVMEKKKEKIVYRDPASGKPVFIDRGALITAGKQSSDGELALMLDYSREKFGGALRLTGSPEFKAQCARVAAEKGMNLILRPEEYQRMMQGIKAELAQAASRPAPEPEKAAAVEPKAETEKSAPPESAQKVWFVANPRAEQGREALAFNSLEKAMAHRATTADLSNVSERMLDIRETAAANMNASGKVSADTASAVVPRHELERARGNDVSEQDGRILELVDDFEGRFAAGRVAFDRRAVEASVTGKNLTTEQAVAQLEKRLEDAQADKARDAGRER